MAQEKDTVLIYFEDKPMSFARIEEILQDSKKGWYQVKFLMLQIPLHVVTWILRDIYIDGTEFTMEGKKIRIELVECPADEISKENEISKNRENNKTENKEGKVISFADMKKK